MEKQIIPVLIGADLNCYNVARAFHEEYGVVSYAFGRYAIGATMNTRIVKFTAVPELEKEDVFLKTLSDFREAHSDAYLILMGCTDEYVNMIINLKEKIGSDYIMPCCSPDIANSVTQKDVFYNYCEKYDIDYPKTVVITPDGGTDALDSLPFEYPVIVKPVSSAEYWHHPFDGMKKVYCAHDSAEAKEIISLIYSSGYSMNIVVQDMIPGDDSHMYVLTSYSDKNGKVKMMCLGHVLLEEHTPKGLGNHCAVITETKRDLMEKFKAFLEDIGYVGFSNFDIKYDERDGSFRAFEINTRQGRSNYYVTASGNNIAHLVVSDYIDDNLSDDCVFNEKEIYWRYIPDKIVKKYVGDGLYKKAMELKKQKAAYSSLRYKYDLRGNLKRIAFLIIHEHNHVKKFKKYYKVEKQ